MHQGVQIPSMWLPAYGNQGVAAYLRRTRTTAGGITDPTDVTNCELWLAADNIVGLNDGDAVTTWSDASGNARDATQATAAKKPIYKTAIVNGEPIVRFDGSDDVLALPNFLTGFTAGEMFVVVKIDVDPPAASGQTGCWNFGSGARSHYPFTDGTIYDHFGTDTRKTTVDPTPALTSFRLYNAISASGEWTSNLNGTQLFTTATNTVGWSTAPLVGQSSEGGGDFYLDGDIAELALYSRKVTTTERDDLESYFSTKYSLGF